MFYFALLVLWKATRIQREGHEVTKRPNLTEFLKSYAGFHVICACFAELWTIESLTVHWERGHFDYEEQEEVPKSNDHLTKSAPKYEL